MLLTTEMEDVLFWRERENYAKFKAKIFESLRHDEAVYDAARQEYLRKHIGSKENFCARIADYAAHGEVDAQEFVPLSRDDISEALQNGSLESGAKRGDLCKRMAQGWALHLEDYGKAVNDADHQTIVELGTGAGLGTWAVLKRLRPGSSLLSTDFDYACVKNADALAKHFGLEGHAAGILANYWQLPFGASSIDVVCAHYSLDECREVPAALSEAARVLGSGGRFMLITRMDSWDRQRIFVEPFGITREECVDLMRQARLMCDPEQLIAWAKACGLMLLSRKDYAPEGSHARVLMVFQK